MATLNKINACISQAHRQIVLAKIEEAIQSSGLGHTKRSIEMENQIYLKATTQEEYFRSVARLIFHVNEMSKAQNSKKSNLVTGGGMQDPIGALQNLARQGTGNNQMMGMGAGSYLQSMMQQGSRNTATNHSNKNNLFTGEGIKGAQNRFYIVDKEKTVPVKTANAQEKPPLEKVTKQITVKLEPAESEEPFATFSEVQEAENVPEKHTQENAKKQRKRKLDQAEPEKTVAPSSEVGSQDVNNNRKRKQIRDMPDLSLSLSQYNKQSSQGVKSNGTKLAEETERESLRICELNVLSLASKKPNVNLALREGLKQKVKEKELNAFKIALEDAILNIPDGQTVPLFLGTIASNSWPGVITVVCSNEFAEKWLKESASKLKVGELQVRLVDPFELIKRVKMIVLLPRPKRETEKILKLFFKQNKGLETNLWVVHERVEQDLSTILVLGVDEHSAGKIKALNYKVFLGSDQVYFQPDTRTAVGSLRK